MSGPIVWCIAGTDSGGGAGLSADQRAADAFGVHLCPVVAAVTAQHSRAVTHVEALAENLLDAQLQALADDMPPAAIKTGLLGSAAQVAMLARWVDRLRAAHGELPLVVDPVLHASSGAALADRATLQAYREQLLPRATLITPNRAEAAALLGKRGTATDAAVPAQALALQALGTQAVCITGGDSIALHGPAAHLATDWVQSPHAAGWLSQPRVATEHTHGTGCTFASSAAAALALGFVEADALVLAKMATANALVHGRAAGRGRGPVLARPGFAADPSLLPQLSFDASPVWVPAAAPAPAPDLYAIVDRADRIEPLLAAGVRTLQLRIKTPPIADAAWQRDLRAAIQSGVTACRQAGARLFVNDHWQLAIELGAHGVHLGQEDLLALDSGERAALGASGVALGVSSHSLWELARARSLAPAYIACGPVWPTLTKVMPWRAQELDNLAWWCAMAGVPVVAIGGVLSSDQVRDAARCGAAGVCAVRVLGDDPARSVAPLLAALHDGQAADRLDAPLLPHPSLARAEGRSRT